MRLLPLVLAAILTLSCATLSDAQKLRQIAPPASGQTSQGQGPTPTPPTPPPSPNTYLLDNFSEGLRIVQPAETTKFKYLWTLETDNGVPGVTETSVVSSPAVNGLKSLKSLFNQSLAGSPSGAGYASNWQFYFYPYCVPNGSDHGNCAPDAFGWQYARQFTTGDPSYQIGQVNRFRFWIFVPDGAYVPPVGYHNFEFGTFLREVADSTLSAESNNWHYYHFINFHSTGAWQQVIIDTFPSAQRATDAHVDLGDRIYPSSATPSYTYFDLLTGWYLDFQAQSNSFNPWPAIVNFYMSDFEFYNEVNVESPLVNTLVESWIHSENRLRLSWNHAKNAMADVDVAYSFSDIHANGWASATLAPNGTGPDGTNPAVPVDPYECTMEYTTTEIDVTGHTLMYVAIKPHGSDLFRQIPVPVN